MFVNVVLWKTLDSILVANAWVTRDPCWTMAPPLTVRGVPTVMIHYLIVWRLSYSVVIVVVVVVAVVEAVAVPKVVLRVGSIDSQRRWWHCCNSTDTVHTNIGTRVQLGLI